MNVLVVDDNELHLKMCRILLTNLGHDVFTAVSLAKVKEQCKTIAAPDAILLDYRLAPGETGVDVLNYIKKNCEWTNAKYIAVTADVSERTLLEKSGFDKVVYKPITESLLKEIIH